MMLKTSAFGLTLSHAPTDYLSMLVQEIMKTDLVTVSDDATVLDLEKLLHDKRVTGMPVVDGDGELLGLVSQSDVIQHAMNGGDPASTKVSRIMTVDLVTCDMTDDVKAIGSIMLHLGIHRVLVFDGQQLVGIVTSTDYVRIVCNDLP